MQANEKGRFGEIPQDEIILTLGRAISNVEDARHAVSGKDEVYLKGLAENWRGALAWTDPLRQDLL
ncbi:MAG: hypothetical protein U1B80_09080 [Anaerolineaceae bacterium]|nr:hypothetical protein [Anaerolineaceae bacterium]